MKPQLSLGDRLLLGFAVKAKVTLEGDNGAQLFEFEELSINAEEPEVQVVLANRRGQRMRLTLSRAELKSLISWRLLLSL